MLSVVGIITQQVALREILPNKAEMLQATPSYLVWNGIIGTRTLKLIAECGILCTCT